MAFTVEPLSPDLSFGKIIRGLTSEDIKDQAVRDLLHKHWVEDGLVVFRDGEINEEFHVALTDMAGNSRASATLADLFDEVRRLHFLLPSVESHITSQEELTAHQHLVSALADGDGARAAELMREHLNEVSRVLVRGFGGV